MKKRLIALVLLLCIILSCTSCKRTKLQYYSQKENYITAEGTVAFIAYNDDSSFVTYSLDNVTPFFDDRGFKLVGDNLVIAQENGIDELIKVGDTIKFVSAPKYFGDGYIFPIVALSKDDRVFLEFEEGYSNLIQWIKALSWIEAL